MITQQVQQSKKACIIFDSTQDYSKKEASVLLLRYLDMDKDGECTVQERVVEVFTTGETTGSVLSANVMAVLKKINFDMNWLIGQCHNGAGNMRGKYCGLATLIQNQCPKAVYIMVSRASTELGNECCYKLFCGNQEHSRPAGRTACFSFLAQAK